MLHGSTDFVSKKTRKSITAHYFPNNFLRSNGRDSQMNRNLRSYINEVKEQNFNVVPLVTQLMHKKEEGI